MGDWNEYAKFFIGLLAIVNPIGMVPVFITLTESDSAAERARTSRVATYAVIAVLVVSLLIGEWVLDFFGIGIPSFRIAGGILIMLLALTMMQGTLSPVKQNREERADAQEKENISVVPLGIPLLAGPGAISAIIIYSHRHEGLFHYLALIGVVLLLGLVTWLSLRSGPTISALLGRTGINIITRIMGLIMAAISVEFIANGLKQIFPVLAG